MNDKKTGLREIHPELKRLFQPVTGGNGSETASSSLRLPHKRSIDTWQGYLLCCPSERSSSSASADIEFVEHDFEDINEAGSFVCSIQMCREDLTNSYRKYLIGKKFSYEEAIFHNKHKDLSSTKSRIAYKIGDSQNISGGTVLKYNAYSTAIDTIYKNAEELAFHILMEHLKVSHENTIELSRRTSDELRYISKSVITQRLKHLTFQDIRHECAMKHTNNKSNISRSERREQKEASLVSIRQMPAYNPDADVNSLCMTIDSWVTSIKRVNQKVDFSTITRKATVNLVRQLTILEQTVKTLQKSLEERDSQ